MSADCADGADYLYEDVDSLLADFGGGYVREGRSGSSASLGRDGFEGRHPRVPRGVGGANP